MPARTTVCFSALYPYFFVLVGMIAWQCSPKPVNDHGCVFTPLAGTDPLTYAEKGLLHIAGSTSTYYYVWDDEAGNELQHQHLNKPLALDPGKYRVKVNNTYHEVEVSEGYVTKCVSGTLIVSGQTTDKYYVTDSTGQAIANEKLGKSVSLFPGSFKVIVNGTEVPVVVRPSEMTEIRTGALVAEGMTGENFYVLDAAKKQLSFSPLGKPLAFLPGRYEVRVNNTSMNGDVFAGRTTELKTGSLLVNGLTDELYYVADTLGNALNFQKLNKALAVFPGLYNIQLNNTSTTGEVIAGQITEFTTGCLTLTGSGNAYYYVFDNAGKQLNHNSLNRWLSFFPSDYTVKLGASMRKATVIAGQQTSLEAFQ